MESRHLPLSSCSSSKSPRDFRRQTAPALSPLLLPRLLPTVKTNTHYQTDCAERKTAQDSETTYSTTTAHYSLPICTCLNNEVGPPSRRWCGALPQPPPPPPPSSRVRVRYLSPHISKRMYTHTYTRLSVHTGLDMSALQEG